MYLIPVTQFLNDVPTSDVSKSVTSYSEGGGMRGTGCGWVYVQGTWKKYIFLAKQDPGRAKQKC